MWALETAAERASLQQAHAKAKAISSRLGTP
jgi:hypothetical protein